MMLKKTKAVFVLISIWIIINLFSLAPPIFLPDFFSVLESLYKIFSSTDGIYSILFSLKRALLSLLIGSLLGIPFGIILGSFRKVYDTLELVIDFFRSVPVSALFPLFLIFFGFGDNSKIAMGAWACGLTLMINTIHGVWSAKKSRNDMAVSKRMTPFQILTKITFFEALPSIFSGLRIGLSWNLIVIIVAEMFIGTKYGLGHIIYDASIVFDTPKVFAGIIIIGTIGYLLNIGALHLEKKIVHWRGA